MAGGALKHILPVNKLRLKKNFSTALGVQVHSLHPWLRNDEIHRVTRDSC